MRAREFEIGLVVALLLGLGLRLAVIAGPLGEIDADEAVVGLMARHIVFAGERPVFYWGQPYLGSLEAFSAAPLFSVFNSSTVLLKLVPTAYSLGFVALSAILARRMFGTAAGLATAAYLALPPPPPCPRRWGRSGAPRRAAATRKCCSSARRCSGRPSPPRSRRAAS